MSIERLRARIAETAPILWVALVAVLGAGVQLVLLAGQPLGWDETIYVSQNANGLPAAFLSAPRSRGTGWLVWPLVHFTRTTPSQSTSTSVS